jgi:hypothetical protein
MGAKVCPRGKVVPVYRYLFSSQLQLNPIYETSEKTFTVVVWGCFKALRN